MHPREGSTTTPSRLRSARASKAARYRKLVLEPGGFQDANVLIQNFLGRPLNLDAFKTELQKK